MTRRRAWWLLAAVTAWGLAGCRSQGPTGPGATPEDTFAAFDKAMQSGDYATAAALVDYSVLAQQANPDFGTFPASQQKLITDKMRESTTAGLQTLGYPTTGGMTATASTAGDKATVQASGGGKSLNLQMQQGDGGWWITGGIPGMTSDVDSSGGE
jgi:hypothetical protein